MKTTCLRSHTSHIIVFRFILVIKTDAFIRRSFVGLQGSLLSRTSLYFDSTMSQEKIFYLSEGHFSRESKLRNDLPYLLVLDEDCLAMSVFLILRLVYMNIYCSSPSGCTTDACGELVFYSQKR